ncbi:MAG TPA: hypothetical protein PLI95_31385, partial [Polyangiaceae bacterium]|nr:hypothetical protein [Polyangiaceae bacterium]
DALHCEANWGEIVWGTAPSGPVGESHPVTMLSLEQYMSALLEQQEEELSLVPTSTERFRDTIVEDLRPTRPARTWHQPALETSAATPG